MYDLMIPAGSGFSIPKQTETVTASKSGNITTISCNFPDGITGDCVIVGTLYEYTPAQTGLSGMKVSNCGEYSTYKIGDSIYTSPGTTSIFAVFVKNATSSSVLYTDSLTTNSGSLIYIKASFFGK